MEKIEFEKMDQRTRACFINCLSGFKSANLIGTRSNKYQTTNLSIVSSCFHLGAQPALMGLIFRPHSTDRHTLEYILESGFFTLNHITADFFEAAHQTSARYPREVSEFEATGLNEEYKDDFFAPFVRESKISLAMKLREHQLLTINQTELVIAEIQAVYAPKDCLGQDGSLDLGKAGTVCVSGLDSYFESKPLARLSYAKPEAKPKRI